MGVRISPPVRNNTDLGRFRIELKVKLMQKIGNYFAESWDEMKNKVSWSSYSELQSSAILVLVASTIFALIIGAMDWVFKTGLQWFYSAF
jgi:preprotein translocase subunit SecE